MECSDSKRQSDDKEQLNVYECTIMLTVAKLKLAMRQSRLRFESCLTYGALQMLLTYLLTYLVCCTAVSEAIQSNDVTTVKLAKKTKHN